MKVSLLDADNLIRVNKLEECSSPRLYGTGTQRHPQGILSDEIFGMSRSDRKSTYAYINLKQHFIHPHVYKTVLKRMFSKIIYIVSGQKKFNIVNGVVTEAQNGWTGLADLYDHWNEIDWSKSTSTNEKSIKLLKLSNRDEIFLTKLIVIPAGYRDVLPAGTSDMSDHVPEVNKMYQDIIRLVSGLHEGGAITWHMYSVEARVQDILVDIYDHFSDQLSGKTGMIKRYLMGKTVNFGTRAVISAPSFNNETIQENITDIDHTALPIAQCCATYHPFIMAWVKNFFHREVTSDPHVVTFQHPTTGKNIIGQVHEPDSQFSDKVIKKMIDNYVFNPDSRFEPIIVEVKLPGRQTPIKLNLTLHGKKVLPENRLINLHRPMTITDVLYLACVDTCEKRHVMVSRYPVGTDKGIFFNKIRVQSTKKHIHIKLNTIDYPFYPDIDISTPHDLVGVEFIDTAVFSNSMLSGAGADYDGDQVSIRGLWSDEANREADEIMNKKMTALNITGSNSRDVAKEICTSYYQLTKIGSNPKMISIQDSSKYLEMSPDDFTLSFITDMFADTTDISSSVNVKRKLAKHQTWDTMVIPANYFYPGHSSLKTTVGRFLVNKYIFQGANIIEQTKYQELIIEKKNLGFLDDLIGRLYLNDNINREQFNLYLDRRDNLGFWLNGMLTKTISPKMIKPMKEVELKKAELLLKHGKEIEAGNISVMNQVEKELLSYARELLKDDPGMDLYLSGELDFENNYKNNAILKGPVLNRITREYDFIPTSLMNGLEVKDLPAHANTIVSGSYPSAIMTAQAGYLGKKLLALLQMAEADEPGTDCGTLNLIPITVTKTNVNELVYSYFKDGVGLKLLSPENANQYIGQKLLFRSPMSCTTTKICSKCVGELPYKLEARQLGLFAVALSHSDLNLALKSKHNTSLNVTYLNPSSIIEDL